jgi:predicted ribosomally synthesized peptide with SipW-like signal peptide
MKNNKIIKTLALAACAILLVVGSVAGTLAYLTDTDEVNNTFTAGKVAITMTESKVDLYGEPVTPATRVQENEYKLIPGHTYVKDPTIYVADDSEECYIFFKLVNGLGANVEFDIGSNWTNITGTNVYYYNSTLTAGQQCTAFNTFTVIGTADVESIKNETVDITAYAVQADGFANAVAAWNATFANP